MPNEMRRPCTLWGETFDATDARICEINMRGISLNFEVWVEVWDADNSIVIKKCFSDNEIKIAQREAITTIANALNAPVLATEEVLAGLPQGSNFIAHKVGYSPIWQSAFYCLESQQWWSQDEPLDESYIIKSDGCAETLARLLEFNTEGEDHA